MSNIVKKVFSISNKIRVGLINSIFWLAILIVVLALNIDSEEKGDTLFIQFSGEVLETPREDEFFELLGAKDFNLPENTLLRDVVTSIKLAVSDKNINNIVLDLDYLSSIGLAGAGEIGEAVMEFRDSGREVFAFSSMFDRNSYYLASYATGISMDPMGEVDIRGLSVYRNYWKNILDRYSVDVKVFRAGKYKSYVEPYISSSMSTGVKEQNLLWMDSIWSTYMEQVTENRGMERNSLDSYFNSRAELTRHYRGDSGELSLNEGFVDRLETKSGFYSRFPSLYSYMDYLKSKKNGGSGMKIGVISLEGTITYSDSSAGYISAVDTEQILDRVLLEDFDGLIVRINSGGGGVFASEIIRRKIKEIGESIPVVISMGDMCASGGYWIATASDYIFAEPVTITGSIGVFGMIFGIEKSLEDNFGIITDGVTTTPGLEPVTLTKNISLENEEIIQLGVDNTYSNFLNLVSESRNIDIDDLASIAEGRVWSGKQALDLGLVDSTGSLNDALEYFGKDVDVVYLDSDLSIINRVISAITGISGGRISVIGDIKAVKEIDMLNRVRDPKNIYALWY